MHETTKTKLRPRQESKSWPSKHRSNVLLMSHVIVKQLEGIF